MNFLKFTLFSLISLVLLSGTWAQLYTQLLSDLSCGPKHIELYENDIQPMPMKFSVDARWKLNATLGRDVTEKLQTEVTIIRTVLGVQLPIRCFISNGAYFGSCTFPDLCGSMMTLLGIGPSNCPPDFMQMGIDCTCPFKLKQGPFVLNAMIPTSGPTFAQLSWLVHGDYYIRAKTKDSNGDFFCIELRFSMIA